MINDYIDSGRKSCWQAKGRALEGFASWRQDKSTIHKFASYGIHLFMQIILASSSWSFRCNWCKRQWTIANILHVSGICLKLFALIHVNLFFSEMKWFISADWWSCNGANTKTGQVYVSCWIRPIVRMWRFFIVKMWNQKWSMGAEHLSGKTAKTVLPW